MPCHSTLCVKGHYWVFSIIGDMCRICHCIAEDSETLISPCDCCGSMKWVHQKCLQKWVKSRDAKKCELCGFPFNMTSSVKPFRKVCTKYHRLKEFITLLTANVWRRLYNDKIMCNDALPVLVSLRAELQMKGC